MASVFSLPPLLFVTFHKMYGVSWTLLGTLMMMEEKIASAGVALYALMAAGGDLGASIAPQLMGILADNYSLKTGMLVCATFPFMGVILILIVYKVFKGKEKL